MPLEDQEVTVLPGVATFQCEVTKMGLKPEWKHGNDVLSPSDKYQMSSQGGVHKLTITDVWGKDESNYTIIFSKDVESTAKLTVKGKHVYSYGITADYVCSSETILKYSFKYVSFAIPSTYQAHTKHIPSTSIFIKHHF